MLHINRIILSGTVKSISKPITLTQKRIVKFVLDAKCEVNVFCKGSLAMNVEKFIEPDKEVLVEGRLEAMNGLKIIADQITFLDKTEK